MQDDYDAPLVHVGSEKREAALWVRTVIFERATAAGRASLRRLDEDDGGAELSQKLPAELSPLVC